MNILFDPQMTSYDMAALETLMETLKPKWSLEIGSWKGLSTSIIARYTDLVFCVDTWQGADNEPHMTGEAKARNIQEIFELNMIALGQRQKARILKMTSNEALSLIVTPTFGFIYIDGDHSYEAVKTDLEWWGRLMPGGIMAGHDFDNYHPGVMRAVTEKFGADKISVIQKSSVWFIQKEL